MASGRILVVDDEDLIRWSASERLRKAGYTVDDAPDGAAATKAARRTGYDLALLDLRLPDTDGISLMKDLVRLHPDLQVIMMTAYSTVETAVEAMRLGAFHYLTKPFNLDELALQVGRALETSSLKQEVRTLRKTVQSAFTLDHVVGTSAAMEQILKLVERVAKSEANTILVRGESGVGKDLIARVLHYESRRADRLLMTITCTTLQETLLESELFGHEKGSFTDARAQKKGLLELADGGTVFMDEIGDMSPNLQAKLLRFLEDKTFRRVGGTEDIRVDVRVVAATNRNLEELIKQGRFREDLYYRLNMMPIDVPPLRARPDDVMPLVEHFIRHFNGEFKKAVRGIGDGARAALLGYDWPGNVRELRNVVERAMLLCSGDTIEAEDLLIRGAPAASLASNGAAPAAGQVRLPPDGISIEEVERSLVAQALERTNWNQSRAARLLNLSRDQIRYRMRLYGLGSRPAETGR